MLKIKRLLIKYSIRGLVFFVSVFMFYMFSEKIITPFAIWVLDVKDWSDTPVLVEITRRILGIFSILTPVLIIFEYHLLNDDWTIFLNKVLLKSSKKASIILAFLVLYKNN